MQRMASYWLLDRFLCLIGKCKHTSRFVRYIVRGALFVLVAAILVLLSEVFGLAGFRLRAAELLASAIVDRGIFSE